MSSFPELTSWEIFVLSCSVKWAIDSKSTPDYFLMDWLRSCWSDYGGAMLPCLRGLREEPRPTA